MRKIFPAVLVATLAFSLSGCILVVKEVAKRLVEARTAGEQLVDVRIELDLSGKLEKMGGTLLFDVNVDAWRGRVMLTGMVNRPDLRDAVGQMTRENDQVRAVYNEIQIIPDKPGENKKPVQSSEEEKIPPERRVNDIWVEVMIQARFVSADGVRTANYHWQSVRNRVYIIGLARSAEEKETVLRIVRETKGVHGYEEFIEVRLGG